LSSTNFLATKAVRGEDDSLTAMMKGALVSCEYYKKKREEKHHESLTRHSLGGQVNPCFQVVILAFENPPRTTFAGGNRKEVFESYFRSLQTA
jgi:hypothetical protein